MWGGRPRPPTAGITTGEEKRARPPATELEPQPELEVPGQIPRRIRADRPERAISKARVRRCKARMIGGVEDLRSHFQLHAFFELETLVDIQVHVVDAVDPQPGKVARSIARNLVARIRKAVDIEDRERVPAHLAHSSGLHTHAHLIATINRLNITRCRDVLGELTAHQPNSTLLKPVLAEGEAGAAWETQAIAQEDFAVFMREAVELADRLGTGVLDQSAGKFLLRLLGDRSGWRDSCTSRACGSGRSLHVVGSDGGVHACPRFVADSSTPLVGEVEQRRLLPLTSVAARPLPDLLPGSLRAAPDSCVGCSWLGSCGGGCTLIGQHGTGDLVPMPDPHCVAYMAIHDTLFATVIPSFLAGRHATSPAFNGARVEAVAV